MARQAGSGGPLSLYPEKAALAAGFRKTPHRPAPHWRVTAPELLTVLRTVEVRGRYETARRLRSTCGSVLRYAIATGRAQRDVTVELQGALIAPKVKHYASIIEPAKVGELLRAIEGYEGQPTVGKVLMIGRVHV